MPKIMTGGYNPKSGKGHYLFSKTGRLSNQGVISAWKAAGRESDERRDLNLPPI